MVTTTGKASELITFSRTSNATLVDSDGRIKWAPHNLLLASEQFDSASWGSKTYVTANAAVAPNGTTTADRINNTGGADNVAQTATVVVGAAYTFSFWAKNNGGTTANYRVYDNTNLADIVAVTSYFSSINGSTWTQITVNFTAPAGCTTANCYVTATNGPTNNIFVWGAHVYRSDLGGMKANTSAYPMYNPTTPKNLLGFTEDFSGTGWTRVNLLANGSGSVANAVVNPVNGLQTADLIVESTDTGFHSIYRTFTSISGTPYLWSAYVKPAGRTIVQLSAQATTVVHTVEFNLTGAGTATTRSGSGTAAITALSDGWYRVSTIATATGSGTGYWSLAMCSAANTTSYLGDITKGVYLWGAQLSDSASLDTYVPNYGAAPTAAAYYGPRLDYDPVTLAAKGLLVEEQRVNRIRYSRTLETTGSYWVSLASGTANTITIDNAAGPDGLSTSASLITYNTAVTGAGTYSAWRHALSTTANGTYTFSIWLKAGTNTSLYIRLNDSGGNRANTLCTLTSSWQRFTVTGTTTASITSITCDIGADGNVGGQTMTAGTVYAYGAQLEAGSFATSYIPNGDAIAGATRDADVASVSTQAFPYSATEGTMVMNGSVLSTAAGNRGAFTLASGGGYISIGNNVSGLGATNADFYNLPAGTFLIASGAVTAGTPFKEAAVYKANDFALSVNGAAAVTSSSGALPTAATEAYIGRTGSSSAYFNGHIRQITYLPRRISNAELITRTS